MELWYPCKVTNQRKNADAFIQVVQYGIWCTVFAMLVYVQPIQESREFMKGHYELVFSKRMGLNKYFRACAIYLFAPSTAHLLQKHIPASKNVTHIFVELYLFKYAMKL